jgi:hypothetical protein
MSSDFIIGGRGLFQYELEDLTTAVNVTWRLTNEQIFKKFKGSRNAVETYK